MNILWESVKATAGIVGQAAVETGMKGKIQAELLLISNEIDTRKRLFGEQLYEFVEPLSKTPDFYAANDRMTETLRGPLIIAQREISALDIRRRIILQKVNNTEQEEKTAYITATNWQETLQNTAKKAGYVSHHAKLKTELSMVDVQIKDFKQVFGLELFTILMELEDKEGWLPTVRDIRSIYDQARRDIEKIQVRQKEKEMELIQLGGTPIVESAPTNSISTSPDDPNQGKGTAGSYFKQVAAVEAQQQSQIPMAQAIPMVESTSIRSIGGPLSYSIPSVIPTATTTSTPQQSNTYNDPFGLSAPPPPATTTTMGPTSTYPPPPSKPQQQQLPPLTTTTTTTTTTAPINPMFAYNDVTKAAAVSNYNSSNTTTTKMDPFADMFSSSSGSNSINLQSSSINTTSTTTSTGGFGFMGQQQQQLQQFQQPPLGGTSAGGLMFPSSLQPPTTIQQQSSSSSYIDPFAVPSSASSTTFGLPPLQQQQQPLSYHNTATTTTPNHHDDNDPFAMLSTTSQPPQLSTTTPSYPTMNNNSNTTTNTNNPLFRY